MADNDNELQHDWSAQPKVRPKRPILSLRHNRKPAEGGETSPSPDGGAHG